MKFRFSRLVLLLPLVPLGAAPIVLDRSTIMEVVNEVEHITMPAQTAAPAVVKTEFKAPDRLQTGRDSRAELQAADGTITRVGSGTLFAFDPKGRELKLERGSLLFHSPGGRGGGTIRTQSASATVLGTTLIAAATADGGYKLLVLEGQARVDFSSGARVDLGAGQMTFVRPAGNGLGAPGPVVPFDLARQVRSSKLVNGFSRALPSLSRIESAIQTQTRAVNQGRFTTTGFIVYSAISDTQVSGIETAGPDSDDTLKGDFTAAQKLALSLPVTLSTPTLPQAHLFRTPLLVPPSESNFLNLESDILLTGLLADTLDINTATLDLSTWKGPPEFNLIAKSRLSIAGSLQFTGLGSVNYIRLFSPLVQVPTGSVLGMTFSGAGAGTGTFYIDTDQNLTLNSATLTVLGGGIIFQPHSGSVSITGGSFKATGTIGASAVVPSAINVHAPLGGLSVTGARFEATTGTFAAQAQSISLRQSTILVGGDVWLDSAGPLTLDTLTLGITWSTASTGVSSAGPLTLDTLTLSPSRTSVFQATSNDTLSARTLDLSGFSLINMGARTIVLDSVHFAAGSTVRLVSQNGLLAANPNTGQNAVAGYVNFIRDVTYDGHPAQEHVAVAAGGTGARAPSIQLSKPTP